MMKYKCICGTAEIPQGQEFSAHPRMFYPTGALLLFIVGGVYFIIGRWFPSVAGCNWIVQPHRRIRLDGSATVEIVGAIECPHAEKAPFN